MRLKVSDCRIFGVVVPLSEGSVFDRGGLLVCADEGERTMGLVSYEGETAVGNPFNQADVLRWMAEEGKVVVMLSDDAHVPLEHGVTFLAMTVAAADQLLPKFRAGGAIVRETGRLPDKRLGFLVRETLIEHVLKN